MLASPSIINAIAGCAEWADRLIRSDLIKGYISTENDYTSNFTGALRREINSRGIPQLRAHTQVLTPSVERITGTDGCIIFSNRTDFKIGLFEAKWPRLSTHTNCWDSIQKSTSVSHFDSQIARQAKQAGYAVWEMFYSEEPYCSNPLFPHYGSACVWHKHAAAISTTRTQTAPWTDAELTKLLASPQHMISIGDVVTAICKCDEGSPYPLGRLHDHLQDLGIKGEALVIQFDAEMDQWPSKYSL